LKTNEIDFSYFEEFIMFIFKKPKAANAFGFI